MHYTYQHIILGSSITLLLGVYGISLSHLPMHPYRCRLLHTNTTPPCSCQQQSQLLKVPWWTPFHLEPPKWNQAQGTAARQHQINSLQWKESLIQSFIAIFWAKVKGDMEAARIMAARATKCLHLSSIWGSMEFVMRAFVKRGKECN